MATKEKTEAKSEKKSEAKAAPTRRSAKITYTQAKALVERATVQVRRAESFRDEIKGYADAFAGSSNPIANDLAGALSFAEAAVDRAKDTHSDLVRVESTIGEFFA